MQHRAKAHDTTLVIALTFYWYDDFRNVYLCQEGIVFGAVCLTVCLSVSEQDYGKTRGPIPMKLGGRL